MTGGAARFYVGPCNRQRQTVFPSSLGTLPRGPRSPSPTAFHGTVKRGTCRLWRPSRGKPSCIKRTSTISGTINLWLRLCRAKLCEVNQASYHILTFPRARLLVFVFFLFSSAAHSFLYFAVLFHGGGCRFLLFWFYVLPHLSFCRSHEDEGAGGYKWQRLNTT